MKPQAKGMPNKAKKKGADTTQPSLTKNVCSEGKLSGIGIGGGISGSATNSGIRHQAFMPLCQ